MDPGEGGGAEGTSSHSHQNSVEDTASVAADSVSLGDDDEGDAEEEAVDELWWECHPAQDPEVISCGNDDDEPPWAAEEEEEEEVSDSARAGPSCAPPPPPPLDDVIVGDIPLELEGIAPLEIGPRKRKLETLSNDGDPPFPCKKLLAAGDSGTCSSTSSGGGGSSSSSVSGEGEEAGEEEGSVIMCLKRKNLAACVPLEKMKVENSIIPSKSNPPVEITEWLHAFQKWSNAERILAIDRLIDSCEPTQVRHMMQVIEPQFQRDFISLLPRELALYVLMFLEPRDLLRAAQTCRYWRLLAEDNLLWRDKCRAAGIEEAGHHRRRHRTPLSSSSSSTVTAPAAAAATGTPPMNLTTGAREAAGFSPSAHRIEQPVPSPWKAAFMRQHHIEMNWRHKPVRAPRVLKGHDDHVITCLQFSGNRIVSGSDDNTLRVWSATTGKCLRVLSGHTGGVWSSQMAGSVIISGSTDRTLKVWNSESGACLHTLYGHTSTVRCMHLHGKKVVSGSRDATLRVWNIETGACLHVLVGHLAAVRCVQYDGRLVVSGAYDYMVKVWNPEREECLHTLQGHTNRVYSLQFDGVHVVSGSLDTSIRVWEVESGTLRHTLMGHQSLTSGMELRNRILVSGNADSTVKVWDIITGQCLQTLSGSNKHQSAVTCLQFNTKFVITSSDDGTVKLWDVKTGEFIRNLIALDSGGSGGVVWRIRANDTKLVCAVGSRNGTEETKLLVLDFDVQTPGGGEDAGGPSGGSGLFSIPTPSFPLLEDDDLVS